MPPRPARPPAASGVYERPHLQAMHVGQRSFKLDFSMQEADRTWLPEVKSWLTPATGSRWTKVCPPCAPDIIHHINMLNLFCRCPRLMCPQCAAIHENVQRQLRKIGDTLYNDR